jgi:hypothetical protein
LRVPKEAILKLFYEKEQEKRSGLLITRNPLRLRETLREEIGE